MADDSIVSRPGDMVPLSYWTAAEMNGAVIFASVPALRQLYAHVSEFKTLGRSTSKTPYTGSGGGGSLSSYIRSRKRFTPAVVTRRENHSALKSDPQGGDITRTTEAYIELEDVDNLDAGGRGDKTASYLAEKGYTASQRSGW